MKQITFLFVTLAVCLAFSSKAQDKILGVKSVKASDSPLFILKVDNRCLEIDQTKEDGLKIDSIDPNTIESIEVIKEKSKTTELYGLKAVNGVVIIYIKDFDLLSKELQTKFKECN